MIKINSNTIYLIGGWGSSYYNGFLHKSDHTWIVDPRNNFKIKKGPSLIYQRGNRPACAKMELNGKSYIIVAGGLTNQKWKKFYNESGGNTVEILDTSSPGRGWIQGKNKYLHILKPTSCTATHHLCILIRLPIIMEHTLVLL